MKAIQSTLQKIITWTKESNKRHALMLGSPIKNKKIVVKTRFINKVIMF